MEERDRLKKESAMTGDPVTAQQYKTLRNEVTAKLRTAKHDHYREKFSQNMTDTAGIWQNVYQALGKVALQCQVR